MNDQSEVKNELPATYKAIPEKDMEDEAVSRPKSLVKLKSSGEVDGADEKMLPNEEKKVSPNSDIDIKDVKITMSEKNGDAKLHIDEPTVSFGGMNKEELMKYANDPFWVRLRWFLFIGFWVLWAAMLVGAILIIYAAPKCDPPPPRTWWQEGPLAELGPDTKPEALQSIDKNIKGLIITWADDAYQLFDETHDTVKLIKQAKDTGIKTIIDLDPSTSNIWFNPSENNNSIYRDYYIWKLPKSSANGGQPEPPNNWVGPNNKSSWIYSNIRKHFYYAPLEKPLLNFFNPNVTLAFSSIIEKFIDLGASGVRLRNAHVLLVDPKFEDETDFSNAAGLVHTQYGFYLHSKTENVPELGKLLQGWKEVISNKTSDGLLMVSEELGKVQSYKVNERLVVDLPLKAHIFNKLNVSEIVNNLNYTFNVNNIEWPLWKVNSPELPTDVLDIVTYLLPGANLVNQNATLDTQLLKIRESPSIMRGLCSLHSISNNTVLAYIRLTPGNPGILVALNTGDSRVVVNFRQVPALTEIEEVSVQYFSKNFNETEFMTLNAKKDAATVPISPKSAIVLSYVPKKKEE